MDVQILFTNFFYPAGKQKKVNTFFKTCPGFAKLAVSLSISFALGHLLMLQQVQ